MSSTEADVVAIYGRALVAHHAFRIHPRGTLISTERLGFLRLLLHSLVASPGGTVH
jgi:hypothetical protein